jgi:hypothetical protein
LSTQACPLLIYNIFIQPTMSFVEKLLSNLKFGDARYGVAIG